MKALITAGGTATSWHLCNIAKQYFKNEIEVHVSDINEAHLVPAAQCSDYFHKVPRMDSPQYRQFMLELMKSIGIDVIIPLIDQDLFHWPCDDPELETLGIYSTGPKRKSAEMLSDKSNMDEFLNNCGLPTPRIVPLDEMVPGENYVVKSSVGCGSQSIRMFVGGESIVLNQDDIIQEKCDVSAGEITAEVFNAQGKLYIFCRQRVETKSGVCTKMIPRQIPEIEGYLARLVKEIDCPSAFCAQFMRNRGSWNMIDCNLRMGAGTALSSAAGFQLARAFWANILKEQVSGDWFNVDMTIKSVLRVYQEVTVR